MNLEQIKKAISDGLTVYYGSLSYKVIKVNNDYFIKNDNKDLCYSFNKGIRTFIYAKVSNKKIKNSLSSKSKSNIDLSNMSSIIKNIHNVKNMTKKELLHLFDLMDIKFENEKELTDEDLRKAYTNFIKKHYNIKDK